MNAMGDMRRPPTAPSSRPPGHDPFADPYEAWRWTKALAVVLAAHAAPLLVAAYWLGPPVSLPAPEPAILIDITPLTAPPVPPSEQPPGPKQIRTEKPLPRIEREVVKTPPVPNPAVAIPVRPPDPPKVEAAPETTAPPVRPAPPAPQASSGLPTWQGLVLGRLNQFKRYPRSAQSQRQQGVPYIRFVMNRDGRVLSSRLEHSSGVAALDHEAVSLPRRAQPLPKPPDDLPGQALELVGPVEFFIK